MKLAASAVLLMGLTAVAAHAGGSARITFLDDATGVQADAHRYNNSEQHVSDVPSIGSSELGFAGPVQVPLVAMVECGHDPRFAGGLTCALPAPESRVAERRVRRDRESPEQIVGRLMDRAIALAPKPRLRITPGRRGLAGLESYFFLAERPRTIRARANAGGFAVTAEARPVQYVWTFGDGSEDVTRYHGRRWTKKRPGNIDHIYETKRRYRVRVEVIWRARWRIGLGPWRTLGFFSNSDSAPYRVGELVPVLVRSD